MTGARGEKPYEASKRAAIHGLLHDIGKPFVRHYLREGKSLRVDEVLRSAARAGELELEHGEAPEHGEQRRPSEAGEAEGLLREIEGRFRGHSWKRGGYLHEEVYRLLQGLAEGAVADRVVETAMVAADRETAGERLQARLEGFEVKGVRLEHHTSPLLSPYALAESTGIVTHEALGVEVRADEASGKPVPVWAWRAGKCDLKRDAGCARRIAEGYKEKLGDTEKRMCLLEELAGKRVWHPVLPIRFFTVEAGRHLARSLADAIKESSYLEVVASLTAGLARLTVLNRLLKGKLDVEETLHGLLRRSLLFVPSAVYSGSNMVALPEISLYAHSKTTAAIAAAYVRSPGCYRLVQVDVRGIQAFIKRHRIVSDAVQGMRGRSIIVELLQRAAVRYLTSRLWLPWSSVLIYEGGVATIVVPCSRLSNGRGLGERELKEALGALEDAVKKATNGELQVATAYSPQVAYTHPSRYVFDPEQEETLAHALLQLRRMMAARKARVDPRELGVDEPEELVGEDPYTQENIHKSQAVEIDVNYAKELGVSDVVLAAATGGKLTLSRMTHLSLAAGRAAVNPVAILEIHLPSCTRGEGSVDEARAFFDAVAYALFNDAEKRYARVQDSDVALVDFPQLCTGYVIIGSRSKPSEKDASKTARQVWGLIKTVIAFIVKRLGGSCGKRGAEEGLEPAEEGGCRRADLESARLTILAANLPELYLPPSSMLDTDFVKALRRFESVSFDWIPANITYPIREENSRLRYYELSDAAKSGYVALAKLDGDGMGTVMVFMSASPSRLVTASELLYVSMGLLLQKYLRERLDRDTRERVYMLYSAGDDAILFGDFPAAVKTAMVFEEFYTGMLPGMTMSGGVRVDDVRLPLYIAYEEAARALEKAKGEPAVLVGEEARQGTVKVEPIYGEALLPLNRDGRVEGVELSSTKWRGRASLEAAVKLAEEGSLDGVGVRLAEKPRLYFLVAATADHLRGALRAGDRLAEAEALLRYLYTASRIEEPGDTVAGLLEALTGIPAEYPARASREALEAALALARNPLNLAYQLRRLGRGG